MNTIFVLIPVILQLLNSPTFQSILPLLAKLGNTAFPQIADDKATLAAASLFDVNSVKWTQIGLNLLGKKLEIDGVYGDDTKLAVTEFQTANGLEVIDGWAGEKTIAVLQKKLLEKFENV